MKGAPQQFLITLAVQESFFQGGILFTHSSSVLQKSSILTARQTRLTYEIEMSRMTDAVLSTQSSVKPAVIHEHTKPVTHTWKAQNLARRYHPWCVARMMDNGTGQFWLDPIRQLLKSVNWNRGIIHSQSEFRSWNRMLLDVTIIYKLHL